MTAQTILPANSVTGGYEVSNSCRFDTNASMTKTSSTGSNTKSTLSVWVKRSKLGAEQKIFNFTGGSNNFNIEFKDTDILAVSSYDGASQMNLRPTRVFRDVSAWYHIVIAIDTTQGTAANRVKIYVNGVQESSFGTETYPAEDDTIEMNGRNSTNPFVGQDGGDDKFFNGYLAELCWIDGSQLAADSFGEFDEDSNIWKPINVSGLTFGTNGFYLDFEDSSNLGNDANGGTDLGETNIAATDQSTDTCTNNFATFNPLDNFYLGGTFSEGNLKLSIDNSAVEAFTTSTIGVSSGKWYMENKIITTSSGRLYSGVVYGTAQATDDWPGGGSDQWFYRSEDGKVYNGGSDEYTGATLADDDIVGIALDLDNHKLYFSKNGAFQNSGDPTSGATGTGAIALDTGQTYFFAVGDSGSTAVVSSANFGSPPYAISSGNADADGHGNFEYAVPSGYFALCSKNLAEYG